MHVRYLDIDQTGCLLEVLCNKVFGVEVGDCDGSSCERRDWGTECCQYVQTSSCEQGDSLGIMVRVGGGGRGGCRTAFDQI